MSRFLFTLPVIALLAAGSVAMAQDSTTSDATTDTETDAQTQTETEPQAEEGTADANTTGPFLDFDFDFFH